MAHDIETTDNLFAVRQPAWHGLGVTFADFPTREEAQALAHPWEPVTTPLFHEVPFINEAGIPEVRYEQIAGHVATVRSDTGATLGVVGDTYNHVKNNELWDIAEAIEGSGADVKFETAGSLGGGKRVWVLIRLHEPITVPGDPNGATLPYYALQNAHDGSAAFRGQAIMTRIVCANTAQLADMDASMHGTSFTFRHTKNVRDRIDDARQALSGWRESIAEWNALQAHLIAETLTREQVTDFVEQFLPEPVGRVVSDRVRNNIATARSDFRAILASPTCEGIDRTAAGMIAAATEYAEHVRRSHNAESKFRRSFLDRNDVVSLATKLALAI